VSLEQSARRFDREGSGQISGQQLQAALQFVRFDYTPGEFAQIRDAFSSADHSSVDWRALCAAVDPPRAAPREIATTAAIAGSGRVPIPTGGTAELVLKVRSAAELAGVDLLGAYQKLDTERNGRVSHENFLDVLHRLPLRLSSGDDRTLFAFYRQSGSSVIDYRSFVESANALAKQREEGEPVVVQEAPVEREIPASVRATLQRFKSFCSQKRIVFDDIFVGYDSNHNGLVPIPKVEACFHNINFKFEGREFRDLVDAFKEPRKPEFFNYVLFTRTVKKEDIGSEEARSKLVAAPISYEIEREASIACGQIREKLMARHRRISAAFSGLSDDPIPVADFQRRLNSVDLVLRANQTQALLRKYRFNLTELIDWKHFCTDVDQSKTI
jgi:Ca2+-binding EF-hand superfamily protein